MGDDNFFLFGMSEPEVVAAQHAGYVPSKVYETNERLRRTIDLLGSGHFTGGDREQASPLISDLLYNDRFLALADFQSYLDAQDEVEKAYADKNRWTTSAILNTARTGFFSSDRSMDDYLEQIWHAKPVR